MPKFFLPRNCLKSIGEFAYSDQIQFDAIALGRYQRFSLSVRSSYLLGCFNLFYKTDGDRAIRH
jgi:hypothetical protein